MRDCGVAAWPWSLATMAHTILWPVCGRRQKTTGRWNDRLGLVKVAEELGFETRAFRADRTLFDLEGVTYPLIVHVIKDGVSLIIT